MQRSLKQSSTIGSFLPVVKDALPSGRKHNGLKIKTTGKSMHNGVNVQPNSAMNTLDTTQQLDNKDIKAQRYKQIAT